MFSGGICLSADKLLLRRMLLICLFFMLVAAQHIRNLRDVEWTLQNGFNVSVPGKLPSQAHLDLYAAGVIGDSLYGFNDVDQLWVQRCNWTYFSSPISGVEQGVGTRSWLVFEGLDTFAEIKLCNRTVADVANQFRQFHFDVTDILVACPAQPSLSLNFGSASSIVLEIAKTGPEYINWANHVNGNEFEGKIYMRKEHNDFGWDWSPALSPAGPWKPAYLVQLEPGDLIFIRNTLIDIYRLDQMNNLSPDQTKPFVFNASIDFLGTLPKNARMHLKLADSSGRIVKDVQLDNVTRNNETITGSTIIDAPVNLWWPAGFGNQNLYTATITLSSSCRNKTASVTKRVGFRTIVLNLNPISESQLAAGTAPGSNWHFEINGHEFYAKGSNFIPPDVFWPRVNETKIQELFNLVVHSNQNMLRIWSSGSYLPDWIYDLADEMGILLWSEFQFSDSEYPTLLEYLENYEAEAYHNIRRINHHPSLALWAGGNELEAVILNFFYEPGSEVMEGYELVFHELLIKCVYANTRSISYIPSSTYNGYLDLDFAARRPQTPRYKEKASPDALYADTDRYDYDSNQAFNFSNYPVGRFAVEWGFPSMPSLASWVTTTTEDQLNFDSKTVLHHNRHYPFGAGGDADDLSRAGIADMTRAVTRYYPTPSHGFDPIANFTAWVYSTQVFQAEYYASEIAFYRRGSAMRERQLGSLYWQLNDLWTAPTWSTVESSGRTKMAYFTARDAYKNVIIRPFYDADADRLDVWVISDLWARVEGTARMGWIDWAGKQADIPVPVGKENSGWYDVEFNVGPLNATSVLTYTSVKALLANANRTAADVLFSLTVSANEQLHSSYFHLASLAESALRDPGLELDVSTPGPLGIPFTVTATKAVAAWVWLDFPSSVRGFFDDNGFWLHKDESRTVYFTVWDEWSEFGFWVRDVTVRSMWNNKLPAETQPLAEKSSITEQPLFTRSRLPSFGGESNRRGL